MGNDTESFILTDSETMKHTAQSASSAPADTKSVRSPARGTRTLATALIVLLPACVLGYGMYRSLFSGSVFRGVVRPVSTAEPRLPAVFARPSIAPVLVPPPSLPDAERVPVAQQPEVAADQPEQWYADPRGFRLQMPADGRVIRRTAPASVWEVQDAAGEVVARIEAVSLRAGQPPSEVGAQLSLGRGVRAIVRARTKHATVFSYEVNGAVGKAVVSSATVYYITDWLGSVAPSFALLGDE